MLLSINDWWTALNGTEQIFWGIALLSSVLFFFQFIVTLFLGFDTDTDVHADVDADGGFHVDGDFALFSMRSVIAFFTFAGWAGVLALRAGAANWIVVLFALFSGSIAMALVAYALYAFSKLTQAGNADIYEAKYQNGQVYLSIPASRSGQGKIHFQLGGSLREMDAVTDAAEPIATGDNIVITDVLDNDLLLVEKVTVEN